MNVSSLVSLGVAQVLKDAAAKDDIDMSAAFIEIFDAMTYEVRMKTLQKLAARIVSTSILGDFEDSKTSHLHSALREEFPLVYLTIKDTPFLSPDVEFINQIMKCFNFFKVIKNMDGTSTLVFYIAEEDNCGRDNILFDMTKLEKVGLFIKCLRIFEIDIRSGQAVKFIYLGTMYSLNDTSANNPYVVKCTTGLWPKQREQHVAEYRQLLSKIVGDN